MAALPIKRRSLAPARSTTAGCEIAPSTSRASAEVEKWHATGAAVGGRSGDVMEHEASGRDFRTINSSHARPRRSVKPLSVFRFALSVFRSKTGPPGVPYTPGCSVAVQVPLGVPLPFRSPSVFRCVQVPLGVPLRSGPPRCSGFSRVAALLRLARVPRANDFGPSDPAGRL